jgi:cyclopropane fatty-acyl-phospholipid synthase-like methyltransferase
MFKLIKKCLRVCLPESVIAALSRLRRFRGSKAYWEERYAKGDNSGAGSYNRLADFKAEILNGFVQKHDIQNVMEFGCGDGNQLSMAKYPRYTGFDVSETAVNLCKKRFENDTTKIFLPLNEYTDEHRAELVLSLDVIFHLVEDAVFEEYVNRLFQSSTKFVIIYASDFDGKTIYHVRNRKFTKYIKEKIAGWDLTEHIPNRYPYSRFDLDNTSWADFYIYSKIGSSLF